MKYSEVVKNAKKKIMSLDHSKIHEHLAVEFDIEGEGEGAFYAEFAGGTVNVEPYDYHDNDFRVRGDADSILKLLDGGLTVKTLSDKVRIEGDTNKAAAFERVLEGKKLTTSKKEAVKLTTSKKEAEKLTTSKKEVEKLTTSKKEAEKLTTSKKEAEKLTTSKKEAEKLTTSKKEAEKLTTSKKEAEKLTTSKKEAEKLTTSKKETKKLTTSKKEGKKLTTAKK